MKSFIFLLIFFIIVREEVVSQDFRLENNDILFALKRKGETRDSIRVIIKNKTAQILLISFVDGIKIKSSFIGIGLYSSVYPFTPDHVSKYDKDIKLMGIRDSVVIDLLIKKEFDFKDIYLSIDYCMLKNVQIVTNQFVTISRKIYDKNVRFLELSIIR